MAAMRAKDAARSAVIRSVLADVTTADKASKAGKEVDEGTVIKIIRKGISSREEAIRLFRSGDRLDLATKEQSEVDFLQTLVPAQMGEDQIDSHVLRVIQEMKQSGKLLVGPIVGKVLKEVPPGSVDPQLLNKRTKVLVDEATAQ